MSSHRKFSAEFKAQVVLELLSGTKSSAELCREHQIAATLLADWKALFLHQACSVFTRPEQRNQEASQRIAELERLVGRLTMENDILKKATSILHEHPKMSARSSRC